MFSSEVLCAFSSAVIPVLRTNNPQTDRISSAISADISGCEIMGTQMLHFVADGC